MVIELPNNSILNLTKDESLDGLLIEAMNHVKAFTIDEWKVRTLISSDANVIYEPKYSSDEVGLSLIGAVIPSIVPKNFDHIQNSINEQLKGYLKSVHDYLIDKAPAFSSTHFMDENGFIDWHTNTGESPLKPFRLYVTLNKIEGSVFKYINNDEVTTIVEPVGWYAKVFNTDDRILHCVKSSGNRYSIGIRF